MQLVPFIEEQTIWDQVCDGKCVGGDDEFSVWCVELEIVLKKLMKIISKPSDMRVWSSVGRSVPERYSWGSLGDTTGKHTVAYRV